jgi:flagellar biosynthesis protein FlhG
MSEALNRASSRATYVAVCSGKGGVGKSTSSVLLASRLAESGLRTLLIDADFGIGDIATMTNAIPAQGIESLLTGQCALTDASLKIGARLWIMPTISGSSLDITQLSEPGLTSCEEMNNIFDVVMIDTPSTLNPLILQLIAGCDLSITISTSRIPAIADSYIQLKQILSLETRTKHAFIINRVESMTEGEQTIAKFGELVEKFINYSISSLGIFENDPRIEKAVENQSLLAFTRQPSGVVQKADRIIKTLSEKYIERNSNRRSVWNHLKESILLKNVGSFDDRKVVVQS